jgi:hypothetical protein
MNRTIIQATVASALALCAGQAFALNTGNIDGTEVKLYFGGATATDNAFEKLFSLLAAQGGVCADGSMDLYKYSATAGGSANNRLMFCTANSNAGTNLAGKKIAVFKESAGGSAEGITPVQDPTIVRNFLPFNASTGAGTLANCETSSTSTVLATGNFAQYTLHTCNGSQVTLAAGTANAGISDIDPTTFVGTGGVTAANAAGLISTSTVGVTFNPIVSVALYRALQTAQGLTTNDTLANMPSMSASQLRAIFNGTLTNGTALYGYNATTGSQVQVSSTSKTLFVCRRGNTSGTMTSFKILFLGEGCSKNGTSIGAFVLPTQVFSAAGTDPDTGDPIGTGPIDQVSTGVAFSSTATLFNAVGTAITGGYGGIRVFAGSGSGDVRKCVSYHTDQGGGGTSGDFAIGVSSTETLPADGTTDQHFRFVRVDGNEPTLKATMEGRYSYFTENTFNRQANTAASNYLAANSDALNLYTGLAGQIGKSTVLSAVNSSWKDGAQPGTVGTGEADVGILDIPVSGNTPTVPVTAATVRSKPVNSQIRNYTGAANNCNMAKQFYP